STANTPKGNAKGTTPSGKPPLPIAAAGGKPPLPIAGGGKSPLPKKSLISSVMKKLGKITPFLHADGFLPSNRKLGKLQKKQQKEEVKQMKEIKKQGNSIVHR
ncbi:hypothetical protein Tco_0293206, partial [Tanacetum coccineum]